MTNDEQRAIMSNGHLRTQVRLYRGKPVRRMHVMVKPTGALCNLDCTYCYYLSKRELLGKPDEWRISDKESVCRVN